MTNTEKIQMRQEKISQLKTQIAKAQERITQLQKEVDLLEAMEMKCLLKEIDMPFEEAWALLKEMRPTAAEGGTGTE